jgi:hypothetical protein
MSFLIHLETSDSVGGAGVCTDTEKVRALLLEERRSLPQHISDLLVQCGFPVHGHPPK